MPSAVAPRLPASVAHALRVNGFVQAQRRCASGTDTTAGTGEMATNPNVWLGSMKAAAPTAEGSITM